MRRPSSAAGKAAETAAAVASALGAIVLGAGLGLVGPQALRDHALPILAAGALVHGAGMTLQFRLQHRAGLALWWERGLFWLCWIVLATLLVGLGWALVRP